MDWQRVQDVFNALVDLPAEERQARLAQADLDEEIRAEVEGLLESLQDAGRFLEGSPPQIPEPPQITQAGPYRLTELIGRGGMGQVYLGERSDDEYSRQVAVKILPWAGTTEERLMRFRSEREILAKLEHPNIARLYDGGTTEDGRPYLVMEYVQGSPIHTYCDENGLTVEERLHLFQEVCSAVSYAHRRLLVHRDLKPGNILVTAEGEPKLLDFGIAKSLDPDAQMLTSTGPSPMTMAYASPEQIEGGLITTASDVYSLGIVLYELLAGRRPHQRVLFPEDLTTRPSAAAAEERGEAVSRRLRGDLDAIVLKALRLEPERRYESVDALSADIERHLSYQPVEARAGALAYYAERFYARHRPAVIVAAASFLALIVFVAALIRQTHIATRQTQAAERERDSAERSFALLTSAFKVSDPEQMRGKDVTARQILDQGADKVRAELKDDPQMQARLLGVLGDVYVSLGLFDTAEPLHREALELRRGTEDEALSLYQLAELEWNRRDYQAAEALYRQALAMFDEGSIQHAQALRGLGLALMMEGHHAEAEANLHQALAALGDHFPAEDPEILRVKFGLGRLAREQGDYDGAERLFREVVAAQRPGGARPSLGRTLAELGDVRFHQGELGEARRLLEEALPMLRMGGETSYVAEALGKLVPILSRLGDDVAAEEAIREILEISPEDHPGIGIAQHNLALILARRGELTKAERVVQEAIQKKQTAFGTSTELALSWCLLGRIHLDIGNSQEALNDYNTCAIMVEEVNPNHPQMAAAWFGLGRANQILGGCEAAVEWYEQAYKLRREALGFDHFLTAWTGCWLGACLDEIARHAQSTSTNTPEATIENLLKNSLEVLQTQGFKEGDARLCKATEILTKFYQERGYEDKRRAIPSCHSVTVPQ